MKVTVGPIVCSCLQLLIVAHIPSALATGSRQDAHIRSLQDASIEGAECSSSGTTSRCTCSNHAIPENGYCWETQSGSGAPCDTGLICSKANSSTSGYCLRPYIHIAGQDCSKAGDACRRGTSCVALDGYGGTNYTSCSQTPTGNPGTCQCREGPIPVNGYCFIYGAACETGSTCFTGRADATGGYCQDDEVSMPIAQGPAPAPLGQTTRAPLMNQACSATGNGCPNGETCVDMNIDEVCGTTTLTGCECSSEVLMEGSRCDLYGAPCASGHTCLTPRPDSTVGKCARTDSTGSLLPGGSDCTPTGTFCVPGTTCTANSQGGTLCVQRSPVQGNPAPQGACTCSAGSTSIGIVCDPWGAPCDAAARCQYDQNGTASCSTAATATAASPTCGPNGPFCGTGKSCQVSSGSTANSCSATPVPANAACQLYGAPCASGTVCRPARADTTSGFCLPDIWDATINKAGAGSSGGGVTGAWTGGVQGPNGAGLSTGSGQSPPPSPPPRTPTSTLRPVAKTAKVYSVKSTCSLFDVPLASFQQTAYRTQFVNSMTNNIEALTGSPVKVTITNYTSGSVIVTTQTDFLDNNQDSATSFSNLLTSGDVSSVFGTEYGSVTVDPKSVATSQVTNPAKTSGAQTVILSLATTAALIVGAATMALL
ncbi:hypothetical protein ABBQ32_005914 [Trebouxia sp. C0010 RCD-2024]